MCKRILAVMQERPAPPEVQDPCAPVYQRTKKDWEWHLSCADRRFGKNALVYPCVDTDPVEAALCRIDCPHIDRMMEVWFFDRDVVQNVEQARGELVREMHVTWVKWICEKHGRDPNETLLQLSTAEEREEFCLKHLTPHVLPIVSAINELARLIDECLHTSVPEEERRAA